MYRFNKTMRVTFVVVLLLTVFFTNAQNLLPKGNFESKSNSASCTAEPKDSLYFLYGHFKYSKSTQDSLYKQSNALKWLDSIWHMTLLDDTSLIQYPLSLAMRFNIQVRFYYDKCIKKFNYPRAYFGRGIMALSNGFPTKNQPHWTPVDTNTYNPFYYFAHHVTNRVSLRTAQPVDTTFKYIISFTVGNDMLIPLDSISCAKNSNQITCYWKKTDSVVVGLAEHDSTFGTEIYRCLPLRQQWSTHHLIVQPKFAATRVTIGNLGHDTTGESCFDNISMYPLLQSVSREVCFSSLPATLFPVTNGECNWPNGITDDSLIVQDTGWFVVRIIKNGGAILDSIHVQVSPSIVLSDTAFFCSNDSIKLDATTTGYTNYSWSSGQNKAVIYAKNAGRLIVQAYNNLCEVKDTIEIIEKLRPPLTLPEDTAMCEGNTMLLNAQNNVYTNYLWNNASTQAQISVKQTGIYNVLAFNNYCFVRDTCKVSFHQSPDDIILCQEDTVCFKLNDSCTLSVKGLYIDKILWDNGDTSQKVKANNTNWHTVTITSEKGCWTIDSIQPTQSCETYVWVPSAFSPNGDGLNDIFKAYGNQLSEFRMVIYNRWGEQIFESNSVDKGWDGTFRNSKCDLDVYAWYIEFREDKGTNIGRRSILSGTVTLMK